MVLRVGGLAALDLEGDFSISIMSIGEERRFDIHVVFEAEAWTGAEAGASIEAGDANVTFFDDWFESTRSSFLSVLAAEAVVVESTPALSRMLRKFKADWGRVISSSSSSWVWLNGSSALSGSLSSSGLGLASSELGGDLGRLEGCGGLMIDFVVGLEVRRRGAASLEGGGTNSIDELVGFSKVFVSSTWESWDILPPGWAGEPRKAIAGFPGEAGVPLNCCVAPS